MATATRKRQIRRLYLVEKTYQDPWDDSAQWVEKARDPRKEVATRILSAFEASQSATASEWVSWRIREVAA
jgi:hypothetical protein